MKLLFCQDCGDIFSPLPGAATARYCLCKRHAVWWTDPSSGQLRCHDTRAADKKKAGNWEPRAFILGITNALLRYPFPQTEEATRHLIDQHDASYLFKQRNSLIVRFRPGETSDTGWADLPGVA